MSNPLWNRWGSTLLGLLLGFPLLSQLEVLPERDNARYETGDVVVFLVSGEAGTEISYHLFRDAFQPDLETGTAVLDDQGNANIEFASVQPGGIFCTVSHDDETATNAVQVGPFDIGNIEAEPADFDAYWQAQLDALATYPLDPQLTFVETHDYADTYLVQLNGMENRPVYGYLSIPQGEGPYPAAVSMPAYGNVADLVKPSPYLAERANLIHFNLSIFPSPPDQADPLGYEPNSINHRDSVYYRYALLAAVRAVDYLSSRDDVIPGKIIATGVSQGGGLANMLAGLDDRIALVSGSNPIFGRLYAFTIGGASSFPFYLPFAASVTNDPDFYDQTLSQIGYYNGHSFARRYQGPSYWTTGYLDDVCPSSTVFGTFNALPGPKVMIHDTDGDHETPNEYWLGRHAFYRRYFSESIQPPFPFEPELRGYYIDAGDDALTEITEPLTLSASFDRDDLPFVPAQMHWRKLAGPGSVSFEQIDQPQTGVSFSQPGTYHLEFFVEDDSLGAEGTFVTLHDDLHVQVYLADNEAPTVHLSSVNDSTAGVFTVRLEVSELTNDVPAQQLIINNGSVVNSNVVNDTLLEIFVQPNFFGPVSMVYPAGIFTDLSGNPNLVSNLLQIEYSPDFVSSTNTIAGEEPGIQIYPNPGQRNFQISGLPTDFRIGEIYLFDQLGRRVEILKPAATLRIGPHPPGKYWLQLVGKTGTRTVPLQISTP